jgi:heme oxygenase (mycobilin-producing)
MTIARHYVMTAAEGKETALREALAVLADVVRALPGSEGVELMRDTAQSGRFIFIEKWTSVEAHKEGGKQVPKDAFSPVMGALAAPPEGAYLDCLKMV